MSRFPHGSAEEATMAAAYPIVVASVSASLRDNADDAALVLAQYHHEAASRGVKPTTAWALLFSASVRVLASEVRDEAEQYSVSEGTVLKEIALDVARRKS